MRGLGVGLGVWVAAWAPGAALALDAPEVQKLLETIDDRQRNAGDWKQLAYVATKEKGKSDVAYEVVIYRRDAQKQFMFLFLKPKTEAGKGYLRIEDNLWLYDPATGKWERRTERERLGGTDSRRRDFDASKLSDEYKATWLGEGTLGKFKVHKLRLEAKPGIDVAWPILELWVDQETDNVLKSQDFALSGKLMRTAYYPKWTKVHSPSKGGEVWYPEEMRFFDEVEKENATTVKMLKTDLTALPSNIFTKAWLESKSR